MGPKVADEADMGPIDSVAVWACVVRWNGWFWVVGCGHCLSDILLEIRYSQMSPRPEV